MKIAIYGMGYLGWAYSAWLSQNHLITAIDTTLTYKPDKLEPSLKEVLDKSCSITYTTSLDQVSGSDLVFVTFDTPIDDKGNADIHFIKNRIADIIPFVPSYTLIVVASQIPVGTIASLEKLYPYNRFAYIPENVRVGKAMEYLNNIDRIVLGSRNQKDSVIISKLVPETVPIIWMSPESAEMTKHTINSFLAINIAFINEIASVCKLVGASPDDVAKGIRSEWRIGKNLPLLPGKPFNSGHLERDLVYLSEIADKANVDLGLIKSVMPSNNLEKKKQGV